MTGRLIDAPLAFVDVETTGGHPAHHRVIEVGVVLARDGAVEEQWSTLVNPGGHVPPFIQRLTGIDPASLTGAPLFEDIADEIARRLDGRLFVAHNANFDYGFIRNEMRRAGNAYSSRVACTVKLSRRFAPQLPRHSLDALITQYDLPCAARHRALPDAMVLWQFWRRLLAEWPADTFERALAEVTRRVRLPPQLPPELADELPESVGVYRFFGEGDALLYIGKAKNLRERVLAHWAGAPRDTKSRRLAEQTQRVAWTETAGELGALLLEAREVRETQPVYNRHLRGGGDALTWVLDDAPGPARLVSLDDGWPRGDAFGLYRTPREARKALEAMARQHALCLKALGLELGEGSCFALQVGRCRGVCVGREPAALHLARAKLALAGDRLRPWPYDGAVAIRERAFNGLEQLHVVADWQYLGTLDRHDWSGDDAPAEDLRATERPSFDIDAYRVLTRFLGAAPQGVEPWPLRR